MNRNEKVGAVFIGYPGPVDKFNKGIIFSGINNFYIGHVLFNVVTELQGYFQGNVGFFGKLAVTTGVFAPWLVN